MNNFLNVCCNYISMDGEGTPKKEIVGSGMYHTVDLGEWEDPFPTLKIGNKGRVHLPINYLNSDIWVFISESGEICTLEGKIVKAGPNKTLIREQCNAILLPKTGPRGWTEIFQSKGKNSGDLLNIFKNGDICVKYKKGADVKVFVRK